MKNRTGKWFFGIFAVNDDDLLTSISQRSNCAGGIAQKSALSEDFRITHYTLRIYSVACYYYNKRSEIWEGRGMTIVNTTNVKTACLTDHLTSFATGFVPEVNSIDFEFVFASASFQDNVTIYICLIIG